MNRGKEVCELLRSCRIKIAEKYGLEFSPRECHHEGDCAGTCPVCDAELQYLQRQLDEKGITDINFRDVDSNGIELFNNPEEFAELFGTQTNDNEEPKVLGGIPAPPEDVFIKEGMPAPLEGDVYIDEGVAPPPRIRRRRRNIEKRRLYKECKIAGLMFRDLEDVWDELEVGTKLALVREKDNKHDSNAVALALVDDYEGDPEDFDFDFALGYIPKAENSEIAMLLDMGWQELFECEITEIKGYHKRGEISIAIYLKNKDTEENGEDIEDLLYAVEIDEDDFKHLRDMLKDKGYAKYHWRCCGPIGTIDPLQDDDEVVLVHHRENDVVLYLMHVLSDDALLVPPASEPTIDDCSDYCLANVAGPVVVDKSELAFLAYENVSKRWPDFCISAEASVKLQELIKTI